MRYGLTQNEIKRIIQAELDTNPDLKYYIDNQYIDELLELLIEGISIAIMRNTETVIDRILREIKRK